MNSTGRGSRHGTAARKVGGFRAKPAADNPHDYFPTPPEVTTAILDAVDLPDGKWCEPCVGDGAVVHAVERFDKAVGEDLGIAPYRRWATFDIRDVPAPVTGTRGYHVPNVDFLALPVPPKEFDVIITNPPFYLAEEFARKCIAASTHVVMLLRLAFLETRKREAFHAEHPSDVYVLSRRPSFMANGATDSCAYSWFHFHPNAQRRWQILSTPQTKRPQGQTRAT